MLRDRTEEEEQVVSKKKMTDREERQKRDVLAARREGARLAGAVLEEWPTTRRMATLNEVLVLAGQLHYAAVVIRPGRYFVERGLLQFAGLHLDGAEQAGGGGA